jgi:hypothetical protein
MSREKADFIIEYVKRWMSQIPPEDFVDWRKRQKEYIKCSKRALRVYDKINKIKKGRLPST